MSDMGVVSDQRMSGCIMSKRPMARFDVMMLASSIWTCPFSLPYLALDEQLTSTCLIESLLLAVVLSSTPILAMKESFSSSLVLCRA